ncbi:ABC transporter transmembrane domain-containing protein [Paractinoplanes atraurantiacus]|uniref:ABC-type multidrug transport system, ATPase and permease component n=1 Tax=Paractinoplanes atraurantiacus TaxID=1036182 RepID=A0A285IUW9_9ACTN|nr:ABC transporter ATP-binding protein [Actinoplanes atraurantiacus]SNY51840.1 ABC-type multidrug transport system, ATPase and permease component [Actinoplanes atraurantiacus]
MRQLPDADPGIPDGRSPVRYLRWLIRRDRFSVYVAIVMAVLWMLCQAVVPAVVGKAIDAATDRDRRDLVIWSLVLLAAGLGQAFFGVVRHRFAVINFLGAMFRTVQVTVRQAGRLGSALPRRLDTGEVVAIGTSDIRQIGSAIDITARGTGSLIAVVAVTVILLTTSVPLGLVVVLGVPLLTAIVGLLIRPLHRLQQASRDQQGLLTGRAADLVGGLRVLRGIGGEAVMGERYRAESQRLRGAGVRTARVESLLEAAQVLLPGIFLVLVTWLGARFALTGHITVGQLVSFYAYAAFLVTPLRQLTEAIDKLTRGHVSARRVVTMLAARTDLPDPAEPRPASELAGELADPASGVTVRPGEVTAIVAAVPADAAAIADRLGRYAEGATAGGQALSSFDLATVRERILVGDNDARLFTGPLRADLDPAGGDRLPAALYAAAATDIVEALPGGLDSEVAERGRSFSGGQQQRLRLVRALVADPDTLVLVEPTSAVDAHTEARIADRLVVARAGRTTVICTSSPLVLDRTDRVFYVEEGRVVATGTHRDLLETEPGYARTVLREDAA